MQVKRFVAADMRRALELVRQELGPDAIILSSGRIPEGVELLTTMGTDNELMQLQQQPLGKMAFASASPMMSDGAWSETALVERAPQQYSNLATSIGNDNSANRLNKTPGNNSAGTHNPGSNNRGKTGQQLVDEIEQARLRMIAARKAEASAQEFLMTKTTRPNSANQPVGAPLAVPTPTTNQKPKAGTSAAERYPLIDPAPLMVKAPAVKPAIIAKPVPVRQPATAVKSVAAPAAIATKPAMKAVAAKAAVPAAKQTAQVTNNFQLQELQAEIADMRFLLEKQLDRLGSSANPLPGSPILGSVSRRLERLGLPAEVVSKVVNHCKNSKSLSDAWPDALANLAHQLPVIGRDIVDQGGIFAFVGPTGVGKTTTIGKLAARYVLKHGAESIAIITTDTYRIASHDQLRSIARILRVPVRVVDENNTLENLLYSLRHCSLVLIDTAGFRHGDPHLKAQLNSLAKQPQVKNYLVLSCNSQEQMLKASVHAYGVAKLEGCILTKLDETASMGEALGVVMHSRLPVVYTTDGQDIPKNIEVARAHQMVAKAVALLKKNPASAVS
ncbi:MAG: flagellar biosynthesis protein FlhF [Pseudomonadota bacterium]